jgi:thioredoxin reductase
VAEDRHVAVLVVGGGPSGLACAAELAGSHDVLVVEREQRAGGIPRHSDHTGYGLRDRHRLQSGPAYAEAWRSAALRAGADLLEGAMVTDWTGEREVAVTSPAGRFRIRAEAVVLATGARERPRPARRIPGDRPDGVLTTGQLQNLVHLHHRDVGSRAVVVGGELVSWSAVLTLREAGCRTVAMVTPYARAEAYAVFRWAGRAALRVPVVSRADVVRIEGRERVRSVVVRDRATGAEHVVACDTVVTTGDWVPDHELARSGGLELDRGTLGPAVDAGLRTSAPGVFAVGNLLHPVDTADVAAVDGTHVAAAVDAWLGSGATRRGVRVVAEAPLRWISPQLVEPGGVAPARRRLLSWTDEWVRRPLVEAVQGGRVVGRARPWWPAAPGRVFRIPSSILDAADPAGGEATVRLT